METGKGSGKSKKLGEDLSGDCAVVQVEFEDGCEVDVMSFGDRLI